MPGRLRSGRKGRLEDLQLFRLYSGSRASPLRAGTAVAAATPSTTVRTFVLRLTIPRLGVSVQGTLGRRKQVSLIIDLSSPERSVVARTSNTRPIHKPIVVTRIALTGIYHRAIVSILSRCKLPPRILLRYSLNGARP